MRYKTILLIIMLIGCVWLSCACSATDSASQPPAPFEEVNELSAPEEPVSGTFAVKGEAQAEKIILEEIELMKEMGLLAENVELHEGGADRVRYEQREEYLYRTGRPYYHAVWYLDSSYENNWEGQHRHNLSAYLDAATGKLIAVSLEAAGEKDDVPVYEIRNESEFVDPTTGRSEMREEVWPYYENFNDLFPEDMTLNRFCDLLNEYWEFDGWALGGGGALDMQIPLRDISAGTNGGYYVALSFEGDEEGKHMYVQICEFPGRVHLLFGVYRMVG